MAGQFVPCGEGATIAYAESIDTIEENLLEVRPTVMTTVPRLLEKIYAKVQEQMASASPLRRKIFNWAVNVGRRRYEGFVDARMDLLIKGGRSPQTSDDNSHWRIGWSSGDQGTGRWAAAGLVSGGSPTGNRPLFLVDLHPGAENVRFDGTPPSLPPIRWYVPKLARWENRCPIWKRKIGSDGEILARGPASCYERDITKMKKPPGKRSGTWMVTR